METSKQCTKCLKTKSIEKFRKRKASNDGLSPICKYCANLRDENYRRSKDGLITKIYNHQRDNCKARKYNPPTYTKQELKDWLFSQELFHELFKKWEQKNFESRYTPSIDRKDDYKSYTIENIKITTWNNNRKKHHNDRKNGINNKVSKAVMQYSMDNMKIKEYHSAREAERQTEIDNGRIGECCKGSRKSIGGYKWKYLNQDE